MSTSKDEFARYCTELLGALGPSRARRMFGGHGFYVDDLFIALIFQDSLYLKVDDQTRSRFEAEGCKPFVYEAKGERVTMGYFTAPDEAMESPALMLPWARLAMQAAVRARAGKAGKAVKKKAPAAKRRRA